MSTIAQGSTPGLPISDGAILQAVESNRSYRRSHQHVRNHGVIDEFQEKQTAEEEDVDDDKKSEIKEDLAQDEEKGTSPDNPNEDDEEVVTYPEGGLQAWLVVFGCFCAMLTGFGMMNTLGTFQAYLSTHQLASYNESSIGWIFSVYAFLAFMCGIQIGPIFDAYGPIHLIALGSTLLIISVFLLGLCTKYWHFLLNFGILAGIGTSLLFTPAVSAIGHFFLLSRGNATGIACVGGSIGGIVFPLMLQSLFPKIGWAWATRILGFMFIVLCIIAQFLIKSRLPPKKGGTVYPDIRIFRDVNLALTTLGVFFMEWGLFIPITYLTSFALASGGRMAELAYPFIAILNVGSCFGRWAPGYVADRIGRFNAMIVTILLCVLTTLGFWMPAAVLSSSHSSSHSAILPLTVTYALLFGFGSGSNISLTPVCVGQLCDTKEYGRYYATCYSVVSIGTLTGIPIAGALISICGGDYWGVVLFTGLCYVVSLAAFVAVRVNKGGWNLSARY